jgi:hypothetical protein
MPTPETHTVRTSDISLREYVDARILATVEARKVDVIDLARLTDEKLAGLKEVLHAAMATLRATIDERDKLYNERSLTGKTAVDAALKSAETAVNSAFAASEKAIVKSDVNAEKWRENANEWRAAMMDRESKFAPRAEVDTEIKSLRHEMQSLKESRAESTGERRQHVETRTNWLAILSLVGFLITAIGFVLKTGAPPPAVTPQPQIIYTPAPPGTQLPSSPPATVPR